MDDAQLKAAFVYRFAQFTQWPPPPAQEFTYCVAGSQGMQEAMQALTLKSHSVAQVRMRYLTDPQQLGQCHLLFLGFVERADLQRWQLAAGDAPLLVVADTVEAFRSGAVIGLIAEPNGLSFRVNLTEAKRRGLMLSSQMLKLAREVR
ncbi:YfiR family protein [Roseateles sp.]|uniref:YfiR family protein n=1 Tax=Roseateles sp. TaxID=1971397 RepID=UPI003BA9F8C3